MNFRRLLSTILVGSFLVAQAQTGTMSLSYSEGEFTSGSPVGIGFGDTDWVDLAIYIPASTMKLLRGSEITGVNGCLTSTSSVETVRIWLRSELEGENLAEFELKPNQLNNIKKGINKQSFKTPWTVPADYESGLYIGFGYKIKDGNARGMSANTTPMPNGFYLKRADGKWYDFSSYGTACIEAIVKGDNLPESNLRLSRVDSPEYLVQTKKGLTTSMYVHNFGTKAITGFDVVAEMEGTEPMRRHVDLKVESGKMGRFSVNFAPEVSATGLNEVTYRIENLSTGDDVDMADNVAVKPIEVVSRDYPRFILTEEFTTEHCGSCPEVVKMIHGLLEKPENSDVIQVCHHAGYKTDFLTEPWHEVYTALYGGGTFAPGVCADRSLRKVGEIVYYPESESELTDMWNKRRSVPALVSVNISASYAEGDSPAVKVTVSGEKSVGELCEQPVVNVWVVESGIAAQDQANGDKDYVHNSVSRAVGTAHYWGDPLTFDNDSYSYTCEIPLKDEWVRENMKIVAFVGNNVAWNKREVKNAASIPFSMVQSAGLEAGVIMDAEIVGSECYDISGKRVEPCGRGIYIRKNVYSDGHIETVKEVL